MPLSDEIMLSECVDIRHQYKMTWTDYDLKLQTHAFVLISYCCFLGSDVGSLKTLPSFSELVIIPLPILVIDTAVSSYRYRFLDQLKAWRIITGHWYMYLIP